MDSENPIPALALKEYWPVGFQALSFWQRLLRKVHWGHRASFRRAWVDPSASAEGKPVLICSAIDSWHSSADAALVFDSAKPSVETLTEYADLNVDISEHSSSGTRVFCWDKAGLKFELRLVAAGKHLHETLAVSRGQRPTSPQLDDHLVIVRGNLQDPDESQRHNCIHSLWRFLFALLFTIALPGIPVFVVVAVIGTALGFGSLTGLVMFFVFIASCYVTSLWFSRRNRESLNRHWTHVFHQGDHDGTVRRALHSIDIELPVENTP